MPRLTLNHIPLQLSFWIISFSKSLYKDNKWLFPVSLKKLWLKLFVLFQSNTYIPLAILFIINFRYFKLLIPYF